MTDERKHELLILFTGFLSVEPGIRKSKIWNEIKEVLDDIGVGEQVATYD